MAIRLQDYEQIVGREEIAELSAFAERVRNKRLQNINSTAVGGGVAEILTRLIPLLGEMGVEATWDVIKGTRPSSTSPRPFTTHCTGTRRKSPGKCWTSSRPTPKPTSEAST